jgi:ABC-type transport system involved in multi-copper enzyme maturation permease subunit
MNISTRRVRAILKKELLEFRHNGNIIYAMAVLPLIFLIQPTVSVFVVHTSAAHTLRRQNSMLYLLAIPALVPAALAAYSVVGERQQGTLEPVLATPIRREELLLGKALAAFAPAVTVAYLVFGIFVAVVELFARAPVASAIIRGPEVLAQVVFTPLLAALSIWIGIAVSARSNDPRTAQQLSILVSLPAVVVTTLISLNVIHPSLRLALMFGIALLVLIRVGWRLASAIFDRERLITNTK